LTFVIFVTFVTFVVFYVASEVKLLQTRRSINRDPSSVPAAEQTAHPTAVRAGGQRNISMR
jgi:hypothetical protein